MTLVLLTVIAVTKFQGYPFSGGVKYTGWGKFTIFDQNRRLSRKRYGAKKFRPTADPLPGGVGWPKFNQLEMVTTFTYRSSLVKIYARNFVLSW